MIPDWITAYNREQANATQALADPAYRQKLRDRAADLPQDEYARICQWLDTWDKPPYQAHRVA